LISGESNPLIKKNVIQNSEENGIKVIEKAKGVIQKNIIKNNKFPNISLNNTSSSKVYFIFFI
jgi:parallel beta-helix repeat protein